MDNKSVKICDEGMEKKIGSDVLFFFSPLRYRIRVLIFRIPNSFAPLAPP